MGVAGEQGDWNMGMDGDRGLREHGGGADLLW